MKRIVIIGGGISGLAAAYHLTEARRKAPGAFEFVLVESNSKPGGIVETEARDGFLLERGPDSFISEKPAALDLVKRLGLESQLIETNALHRRSYIVRNGNLRPVPEGFQLLAPTRLWPFITSDIFSWTGKARMALDLVLPRRQNGQPEESLASFVTRRLGREALERMAQPMVGGIYTADPERLSLRATLPRFLDLEQSDRSLILGMLRRAKTESGTSGARYSLFLSFDRGMQVLTGTLAARLTENTLRLNSGVKRLLHDEAIGRWNVQLHSDEVIVADAICLAVSAPAAASLLTHIDERLARELSSITYESTATINLAFKRTDIAHVLDGFGFVVPLIERRSLLACTFSSVKFAGRAPDHHVLLRAFIGGALQPEMFALDEDEMLSKVLIDLRELIGVRADPILTTISKWRESMPQYHVGHLEKIERINQHVALLSGLSLAGSAYEGVGIPDCIRSGETAASLLLKYLLEK